MFSKHFHLNPEIQMTGTHTAQTVVQRADLERKKCTQRVILQGSVNTYGGLEEEEKNAAANKTNGPSLQSGKLVLWITGQTVYAFLTTHLSLLFAAWPMCVRLYDHYVAVDFCLFV